VAFPVASLFPAEKSLLMARKYQLSLAAAGEGGCYKRRVGEAGVGDGTGAVTADGIGDSRPEEVGRESSWACRMG
jgi:hypothetical protein